MTLETEKKLFPGFPWFLTTLLILFWGVLGKDQSIADHQGLRAFSSPFFSFPASYSMVGGGLSLFFLLKSWKKDLASSPKSFLCGSFWGLTLFFAFLYAGNSWAIALGGPFFLLFLGAILFREKHKGSVIFTGERLETFLWLTLFTLCNAFFYQEGFNFLSLAAGKLPEVFLFPFLGLFLRRPDERALYVRRMLAVFCLLLLVYAALGLYFDLMALSNFSILFLFLFAENALALFLRSFFPAQRNFSLLVLALFLLLHSIFPLPGMQGNLSALAAFLFYIVAENLQPIQTFFQQKVLERVEQEKIFTYSFRGYQTQAWTCGAFVLLLFTGVRFLYAETALLLLLLLFLFAFFRRKFSFLSLLPRGSHIPEFALGAVILLLGGILHKNYLLPCAGLGAFTLSLAILYTGKWLAEGKYMGKQEKESYAFYAGGFFLLFLMELYLLYSQTSVGGFLAAFFAGWGAILLASSPFSRRKLRPFTGGILMLGGLFLLFLPAGTLPAPCWTPGAIYGGILAFALTSFYYMLKDNYLKEGK